MTTEPPLQDRRSHPGTGSAERSSGAIPPEPGGPARPPATPVPTGRRSLPTGGRRLAFVLSLVVLIAAVPILSWVGLQLIRSSRSGRFVSGVTDPRAPGYEALVEPTPTALVIEKDQQGKPVALVVLALGHRSGGGSAMFVPLSTRVVSPGFGVDRLGGAFAFGGAVALVGQIGQVLHLGFSDVIDIDSTQWADLIAPVAPLSFDNPDTVRAGRTQFPAGRVALRADQVADYLQATSPGESELNRLNRHELFWQAWLAAIGASSDPGVVPGEAESGLGLFVRTLARGPVTIEPLPLRSEARPSPTGPLMSDPQALRATVARMVPFPAPPTPNARVTVRLLNGVDGRPLPETIGHQLVQGGGSIFWIGNDRRTCATTTVIEYRDPAQRHAAEEMRAALGGHGTLRKNPRASDAVDVSVIVGSDVLDQALAGPVTTATTAPTSVTPPNAGTGSTSSTRGSTGIGG